MTDLLLIIGLLAIASTGYLIWKLWANPALPVCTESTARRREDARDWQRRFGPESLLAANFLQPTQNEILETLYVLDHLTPGWEAGEPEAVERLFLHELAVNFPTLRKDSCVFPLPFAETLLASRQPGVPVTPGPVALQAQEEEILARREKFRLARAHFNAFEQMATGPADPTELSGGNLPERSSGLVTTRRQTQLWLAALTSVTALLIAVVALFHFGPRSFHQRSENAFVTNPSTETAVSLPTDDAKPSPSIPVVSDAVMPSAPTPAPTLAVVAAATPETTPPSSAPAVVPSKEKALLEQQVAASKQRALSKYPALAVEGSEINLRFVFRYKNLVQQNSPRLLDPNWPEQLVEECAAAAAGATPKRNAFTRVLGSPH